jgi:hypothetical protein
MKNSPVTLTALSAGEYRIGGSLGFDPYQKAGNVTTRVGPRDELFGRFVRTPVHFTLPWRRM